MHRPSKKQSEKKDLIFYVSKISCIFATVGLFVLTSYSIQVQKTFQRAKGKQALKIALRATALFKYDLICQDRRRTR